MPKQPKFDYDEYADVMYISFGEPKSCKTIEPDDIPNIILRYTPDSDELNGITIINYNKKTKYGNYHPYIRYDRNADVMYISFTKPKPSDYIDAAPGIVFRYMHENILNGITIIDYNKRTNKGE